jgi:hypothetical protein
MSSEATRGAAGADLTVWIASPSLLLGDVAAALRAPLARGPSQMPSAIRPADWPATHRPGHKQDHKHGEGRRHSVKLIEIEPAGRCDVAERWV